MPLIDNSREGASLDFVLHVCKTEAIMPSSTVTKTVRIPSELNARLVRRALAEKKDFSSVLREAVVRGLPEDDGIDMIKALGGTVGKYAGNGESQAERMKRYGRPRDH